MIDVLTERLPTILEDFPDISLVYLFGSQVSGQVGPMSDFDLAISCEFGSDVFRIQSEFQYAVSRLLDTERVDIVVLQKAPVELAYHVIYSGKLIYQKDLATRVEVEARILGEYFDYLPVLRMFQKHALSGGAHAKRAEQYREALERTQRHGRIRDSAGRFRTQAGAIGRVSQYPDP